MTIRDQIYKVLDVPFIYNLNQLILAPGSEHLLNKYFNMIFENSGGRILDVGCGPALTTPKPNGKLIGVDISHPYIRKYSTNDTQRGIVGNAADLPFKDNTFDESRCFGLFHHLPGDLAFKTVMEMIRCTKPDGQIILMDSVWPKKAFLRPLAWLNLRLDRGQWMLNEEQFTDLANKAYPGAWQSRRFTYTYVGHEALALSIKKN